MPFFSCTVNEIGPAADGTETANPVIYMNLTDTGGSFVNQWFYAAEASKTQMLSVGLAAMSANRQVEVAIDNPHVPYSSVARMYLLRPVAQTKLLFIQNLTPITTNAQGTIAGPIDISAFAKIRIFVGVLGSGGVGFGLSSSGYDLDYFIVNAPGPPPGELTRVYDVPGTELYIVMTTTDSGMQAQFGLFGN
jgi:hypothetical protein